MPEQQQPVPGKSYIGQFATPDERDFYVLVYVDTKRAGYKLPEYGDPHPDQQQFDGFKLSAISPDRENGTEWALLAYTRDRNDQDAYNADQITYPYGSNSYPRILRTYIYSAGQYANTAPLALGTADPEVDGSGTAVWPSHTLIEPDIVSGATGDELLDNLFVKVTRIYEILPGAAITTTRLAEDGTAITITTQRMLIGSIVTNETLTGGTTPWVRKYKGDGNAYYAEQITESRPIPGNGITSTRLDEDGIPVTITRTLKRISDITTQEVLSASPTGVWAQYIRVEANSTLVAYEQVEYRAIPGNVLSYRDYDPLTTTIVESTQQLISAAVADYTPTSPLQDYKDIPYNGTLVKMRTIRNYPDTITSVTIIEYKRERYSYPALLSNYATSGGALQSGIKSDGSAFFLVNDSIEAERVRLIPARITTTFQTNLASPALPVPLAIQPQRLGYNGALEGVAFITGPVLCNAQTIIATIPSGDPNWTAGTSETVNVIASSPTKDTWTTARALAITAPGRWFISDFDVKKIGWSLFMVSKVEIPYY